MLNSVQKFKLCFIDPNLNPVFRYLLFDLYMTSPVALECAAGSELKHSYVVITCSNGRRKLAV